MKIKRSNTTKFIIAFLSLSIALFCVFKVEKAAGYPLVRLTDTLNYFGDESASSLQTQLDGVVHKFRFNPIIYARIYDYNVESGPAKAIYRYQEALPLGKHVDQWMTRDGRWRVEAASVFNQTDFLFYLQRTMQLCILVTVVLVGVQLYRKIRYKVH